MLRMRAGGGGWDGDGMEWNGSRAVLAPCLLYALPCPALPCLLAARQPPARAGGGGGGGERHHTLSLTTTTL